MAKTPNQPTLPVEIPFTDAEHNFIEESPDGLFPENQNSNFGLVRRCWTDQVQDLIGQQDTIYNERFVDTSADFLDMWEQDVGLPAGRAATRTVAQRRLDVLTRIIKGPFTVPLRNSIIENAIGGTFGTVPALTPAGIAIPATGIPLYAEFADVTTLYVVRDNTPGGRNLLANGNFENNTAGWTATAGTLARVTSDAKWGLASLRTTMTAGGNATIAPNAAISGATAGRVYVASFYVKGTGSAIGKNAGTFMSEQGGAQGPHTVGGDTVTLSANWQRIACAKTIVQNDRTSLSAQVSTGGLAAGEIFFLDGAQVELAAAPSVFVDPEKTPFYYEVRIKNTVTPDMVSLLRELKRITPASISFDVLQVADV